MIKVFEAFAGIGTQRMALRNLDIEHEVVAISEIDKFAIKSYEAIHGQTRNLGDITKINTDDIPDHDLFTYSFPCFTGETLVHTNKGYKRIDEIEIGDFVTTHKNRYKKVTKVVNQGKKPILKIEGMAIDEIKTTQNHKFLVRKRSRKYDSKNRTSFRVFGKPQWLKAEELTRDCYLGIPINNENKIPEWKGYTNTWNVGFGEKIYESNLIEPLLTSNDFWWLMGRYVADGWCRKQGGIVVATNEEKLPTLEIKLKGMFKYNITKEKTCYKVHIPLKELSLFVERFGYYAHNKKISQDVLNLPRNLLKSFLDGYMSGDGSFDEIRQYYKATTTSKLLVYGLGQCVLKVYNRPYSIYKSNRPKETIIEGRKVSQNTTYDIVYKIHDGNQDKAFCEDGYGWFPFNKSSINKDETVYDIEVEDDHSFTANNVIVHNCQDISIAGKMQGLNKESGTRSSLLWECERIIKAQKPKYLLMENVKNLVEKKFRPHFEEWLQVLEDLGYSNHWRVLNAHDFGVPQNRERVFCVSILDSKMDFHFPTISVAGKEINDILDSNNIVESFYLDKKQAQEILNKIHIEEITNEKGKIVNPLKGKTNRGWHFEQNVYTKNSILRTLKAGGGSGNIPKIIDLDRKTIRKLTPLECWRAMGCSDEDFYKAQAVNSNTQLYKQAGNAIVVDVLEAIFANMPFRFMGGGDQ